ncbi:MAG TPA: DUF3800 domain-containing protein [Candidatus Sulfotelmatobacter sp.]|jgi:hypothetical protein|nr:DUF3800 domain-containing protein [Candidatus Sulfotelmatobacter sp.]
MAQLYTAYIDDSGTAPDQEVAIASALVIPASKIQSLQVEWDAMRIKEVFPKFHMSEFSSPTPSAKSHFRGWGAEKHDRVYQQVRDIIMAYGAVSISFAVYKKDYDEVVPPEMRKNAGTFHYTWAVRHMLAGLERWRKFFNVSAPFEFIFDHLKKSDMRRQEIEDVMEQGEEISPGVYLNYTFRDGARYPGLQCVDVLGWISYQLALKVYCGKRLVRDAVIGWDEFEEFSDSFPQRWRLAAALKRSELERWVKLEIETGVSQPFFDQWNVKKEAKRIALFPSRKKPRQP